MRLMYYLRYIIKSHKNIIKFFVLDNEIIIVNYFR